MKKLIIILSALVVLGGLFWTCYWFCLRNINSEEANMISQAEAERIIKELFVQKYPNEATAITVTAKQIAENHIRGEVLFGSREEGSGGIFFVAKVDDEWQIVWDGNGIISCEDIGEYGFPQEMLSDCAYTQRMEITKDEEFGITLESNATTGYKWMVDFDESYLTLMSEDYSEPGAGGMVGASGFQTFKFKALKKGEVRVRFAYLRPWESQQPIDEKIYTINIK